MTCFTIARSYRPISQLSVCGLSRRFLPSVSELPLRFRGGMGGGVDFWEDRGLADRLLACWGTSLNRLCGREVVSGGGSLAAAARAA